MEGHYALYNITRHQVAMSKKSKITLDEEEESNGKEEEYDVDYKRFKDFREHMLLRPDAYGGPRNLITVKLPVLTGDGIVLKEIEYSPLSVRMFIEVLDNAMDAEIKGKNLKMSSYITNVTISSTEITVVSGGAYIAVKEDEEDENTGKMLWTPTTVFGRLLSGSNFDEGKTVKGKNGMGAKLIPVFSDRTTVECADPVRHILFKQTWRDHGRDEEEPEIDKKYKGKVGYVKVNYTVHETCGVSKYSKDVLAYFSFLVASYSFLADSPVILNNTELDFRDRDYVELWPKLKDKKFITYKDKHVNLFFFDTPDHNYTISFVNGGYVPRGGEHVKAYAHIFYKQVLEIVKKKYKDILKKAPTIKIVEPHVSVIISATIEDPDFESQSKLECTGPKKNLKHATLPDFTKEIADWGIFEAIEAKLKSKLKEGTNRADTKKTGEFRVEDAIQAKWAGTKNKDKTALIIVEGESGITTAIKGRNCVENGQERFGITHVQGKIDNLTSKGEKKRLAAKLVKILCLLLGLKPGDDTRDPAVRAKIRYAKILLMTDADHDGTHIRYLAINLLREMFPGLLEAGFVQAFLFPTVTAIKGKAKLAWYTLTAFEEWKKENNEGKGYEISYFKGLGTCSDEDIAYAFENPVNIRYVHDPETDEALEKVFNKKRADDRKKWMQEYDPENRMNYENDQEIMISDGVNKELILYSIYSVDRGIPNFCDGLLRGARKVVYTVRETNVNKLIKVAQLGGKVAEKSEYHHGEKSLEDTIKKLAQKYPSSNNIALLKSHGQLGSRRKNGHDAASSRYTYACKGPFFDVLFTDEDDMCLDYQYEGKDKIEPLHYRPVVCMTLINGVRCGIGTGWMSKVPAYNPRVILSKHREFIAAVRVQRKNNKKNKKDIDEEEEEDGLDWDELKIIRDKKDRLTPWYRYYRGEIKHEGGKIVNRGTFTHRAGTITISEIPIGVSFEQYKEKLEELLKKGMLKRFPDPEMYLNENGNDSMIQEIKEFEKEPTHKNLCLTTTISTTCLNFFDERDRIIHFDSPEDLLDYFHKSTLEFKVKVLEKLRAKAKADYEYAKKKVQFLEEVMETPTLIAGEDDEVVDAWMIERKYDDKLLNIPIKSITIQAIERTKKQMEEAKANYKRYKEMQPEDFWEEQLNTFEKVYDKVYHINGEEEPGKLKKYKKGDEKTKNKKGGKVNTPKKNKTTITKKKKSD